MTPPRSNPAQQSATAPSELLRGVLPVLQTPYHDDESIDFATLMDQVDWLYARGANGVVLAMVSEWLRLSDAERSACCELVCEQSAGRGAVVVSVGAESAHAACENARRAEATGATAVMAIPPLSIAAPERELVAYYERILESVSIPVILQDASGYVGAPMPVATMAKIFERYGPDRVYFKPEAEPIGPTLSALHDATGGAARVFDGSGGLHLVDCNQRGIVGTMPGADLIDALVALWNALERGDADAAARIAAPLCSIVELQVGGGLDGFLAIEKHLLVRQGVFKNDIVRRPAAFQLDDATRRQVDALFDQLQQTLDA